MPKYIFNAPEHHKLRIYDEQSGRTTEYSGGHEFELAEERHAQMGDPRLIPADTPGFQGVPVTIDQGEPDEELIRARAIDNQPVGTDAQYGEHSATADAPQGANVGEGDERQTEQ